MPPCGRIYVSARGDEGGGMPREPGFVSEIEGDSMGSKGKVLPLELN